MYSNRPALSTISTVHEREWRQVEAVYALHEIRMGSREAKGSTRKIHFIARLLAKHLSLSAVYLPVPW